MSMPLVQFLFQILLTDNDPSINTVKRQLQQESPVEVVLLMEILEQFQHKNACLESLDILVNQMHLELRLLLVLWASTVLNIT